MKIFMLVLCLMSQAFADEKTISQELGSFKNEDIQARDINPVKKHLAKQLKKDVDIQVDWKSFEGIKYSGSQELGATIQMLPQVMGKLMSDKDTKKIVEKDLSAISLKNDVSLTAPTMSFEKGVLGVMGNFNAMNWQGAGGSMSGLAKKVMLKK
jgi:hypothetical protein